MPSSIAAPHGASPGDKPTLPNPDARGSMTTPTQAQVPSNFIDITGKRFGKWTVVDRAPSRGDHSYWNCICECGTKIEVESGALRYGKTTQCKSCCQVGNSHPTTHGKARMEEYRAWSGMKTRCLNPNNKDYKNYGGRGIKIYPEWIDDFIAYDTWCNKNIGPRPSPDHTRDRIDNDGHYWPGNIRWATYEQQANNRRKTAS